MPGGTLVDILFTFFSCPCVSTRGTWSLSGCCFLIRKTFNTLSRCICAHHELFTGLLHNLHKRTAAPHSSRTKGCCVYSSVCRMWLNITAILYYCCFLMFINNECSPVGQERHISAIDKVYYVNVWHPHFLIHFFFFTEKNNLILNNMLI